MGAQVSPGAASERGGDRLDGPLDLGALNVQVRDGAHAPGVQRHQVHLRSDPRLQAGRVSHLEVQVDGHLRVEAIAGGPA